MKKRFIASCIFCAILHIAATGQSYMLQEIKFQDTSIVAYDIISQGEDIFILGWTYLNNPAPDDNNSSRSSVSKLDKNLNLRWTKNYNTGFLTDTTSPATVIGRPAITIYANPNHLFIPYKVHEGLVLCDSPITSVAITNRIGLLTLDTEQGNITKNSVFYEDEFCENPRLVGSFMKNDSTVYAMSSKIWGDSYRILSSDDDFNLQEVSLFPNTFRPSKQQELVTHGDSFLVLSGEIANDSVYMVLDKLDFEGNNIWSQSYPHPYFISGIKVINAVNNQGLTLLCRYISGPNSDPIYRILFVDGNGFLIDHKDFNYHKIITIEEMASSNYMILWLDEETNGDNRFGVSLLDQDANIIEEKSYNIPGLNPADITAIDDHTFLIVGDNLVFEWGGAVDTANVIILKDSFQPLHSEGNDTKAKIDVHVFPNPTTGRVQIKSRENLSDFEFHLVDIAGKRIAIDKKILSTRHWELNLAALPSGAYTLCFLETKTGTRSFIKMLVKE